MVGAELIPKHWITIGDVARVLDISRPTARKRLLDRLVPGLKDHHGIPRVDRKTFEEWALSKDLLKK